MQMKLVLLPGNSKSNKEWAEKTSEAFSDIFKDIYTSLFPLG